MTPEATLNAARARRSLSALEERIESSAQRVLENVAAAAERLARSTTAFRDQTGALRASIVHGVGPGLQARVIAGARHARFLEFGTRAHGPVHAKALRFVINGAVLYRRWVRGVQARHFMRDTEIHMRPIFVALMDSAVSSAIRRGA